MSKKDDAIVAIREFAKAKGIDENDLAEAFGRSHNMVTVNDKTAYDTTLPTSVATEQLHDNTELNHPELKFNAPKALFFTAGILLFIGIMVGFGTNYEQDSLLLYSAVSTVLGLAFWVSAFLLLKSEKHKPETLLTGLGDAATLTGTLLFSAGIAFLISYLFSNLDTGSDDARMIIALTGLLLGTLAYLHYLFDKVVKRVLPVILAGIVVGVSYYTFMVAILYGSSHPLIWTAVTGILGLVYISVGRLFAMSKDISRRTIKKPFYSLGGFISISSLYWLIFNDSYSLIMTILFPAILYAAFVASIRMRSKTFLLTGTFFLIAYIIGVISKYFGEGLGASFAFMFSAVAILASGVFGFQLKNKYFKD